ncbi:hypothetical protein [Acidovorax sp. NCPPB 3576]|uniref:hypothetical protein n=1 Tax=Acidovorax sp. NCPPB 3576 TaxID=2940488 RepID=UPI00234BF965|nr:hypothetical protein [Acidovorax sp. NCPPB 3576]WCM89851.1 hypothetical protein M5C98_07440 [Acidovorax sp. NCPPB 3576]
METPNEHAVQPRDSRWSQSGVWQRVFKALAGCGQRDAMIDATIVLEQLASPSVIVVGDVVSGVATSKGTARCAAPLPSAQRNAAGGLTRAAGCWHAAAATAMLSGIVAAPALTGPR